MWKEDEWKDAKTQDRSGSIMYMDPPHVMMLYQFIMANNFKKILEIGCWDGYSTSALVQACRDGKTFRGVCCDIELRDNLKKITAGTGFTLLECTSLDAIHAVRNIDCVIIDGDHSLANVQHEWEAIARFGIPTIVAHDVGPRQSPGPSWLLAHLRRLTDWRIAVDNAERSGMYTDRGLMFASKDGSAVLP